MSNQSFQGPARARGCFRLPTDGLGIGRKSSASSYGVLSLPQASKSHSASSRAEEEDSNNGEMDQEANDDNNVRVSLPCTFDWRRRHSAGRVRSRLGCNVAPVAKPHGQATKMNLRGANAWTKYDGEEEPEEMEQDLYNQEDNESDAGSNQSNAAADEDLSGYLSDPHYYDLPVAQYDLESVTKAQRLLSLGLSAARRIISPRSRFQMGEDDDSFMNVRSPVVLKASVGTPTPESTSSPAIKTRRSEPQKGKPSRSLGWADDQFTLYHEVLSFLETACASASPHVSITSDRLAQMQQLLQALHPAAAAEQEQQAIGSKS